MQSKQPIPFKVNSGLPQQLFQEVEEKSKELGWEAVHILPVEDISIAHWVQLKCRFGCSSFNSNWCCPPATPGPDSVRQILQEYSNSLLLVGRQSNPSFYNNSKRKRAKQVRYWKETVALERYLFLRGYYKAFSLLSGSCALCGTCAYPHECYFPKERRPSVESFCIDLIATIKNLGLDTPVATSVTDVYYHYAIMLVE